MGIVLNKLSGVSNVHLIEPLDYMLFVELMLNSYLILTDSGGIQEEAPSLDKPVLLMRETLLNVPKELLVEQLKWLGPIPKI